MTITFKPYTRRDGSVMLYVNRGNGVSVGISAERGFSPYGRGATQGQRNAMAEAYSVIRAHGRPFTGDLAAHTESGFCAVVRLANGWSLAGTDVGNIGGMEVGGDGMYLVAEGLILRCGEALAEAAEQDDDEDME